MCCFYHTSNTINLVTASLDASVGILEHTIFIPDVTDSRAPTHGVIFAKYVAQITKQQGRYAVGHVLSPLVIRFRGKGLASVSRCMHRGKVAARRGVLIVQIIDCRNRAFTRACAVRSLKSGPMSEMAIYQQLPEFTVQN
jgi:hypothetical protein